MRRAASERPPHAPNRATAPLPCRYCNCKSNPWGKDVKTTNFQANNGGDVSAHPYSRLHNLMSPLPVTSKEAGRAVAAAAAVYLLILLPLPLLLAGC